MVNRSSVWTTRGRRSWAQQVSGWILDLTARDHFFDDLDGSSYVLLPARAGIATATLASLFKCLETVLQCQHNILKGLSDGRRSH